MGGRLPAIVVPVRTHTILFETKRRECTDQHALICGHKLHLTAARIPSAYMIPCTAATSLFTPQSACKMETRSKTKHSPSPGPPLLQTPNEVLKTIIEFAVDGQDADLTLEAQRQPPNPPIRMEMDIRTASSLLHVNKDIGTMMKGFLHEFRVQGNLYIRSPEPLIHFKQVGITEGLRWMVRRITVDASALGYLGETREILAMFPRLQDATVESVVEASGGRTPHDDETRGELALLVTEKLFEKFDKLETLEKFIKASPARFRRRLKLEYKVKGRTVGRPHRRLQR